MHGVCISGAVSFSDRLVVIRQVMNVLALSKLADRQVDPQTIIRCRENDAIWRKRRTSYSVDQSICEA